jgi:hypothetical protein
MAQDTAAAVAGLPEGTAEALKAVLDELQASSDLGANGVQVAVVAGAAATTNIPITGIKTTDKLVAVVQLDVAVDTGTSATGNKVQDVATVAATITSTGNIQLTSVNATGDKLLVVWVKRS